MWIEDKYLNLISARLPLFKKTRDGVYNCRCPICGDSRKSKTKARGYFFERKNTLFYDCKNCGAKGKRSFSRFLEWFDPELYKEYKVEMFKEKTTHRKRRTKNTLANKRYRAPQTDPNSHLLEKFLRVSDADPKHSSVRYLADRLIPEEFWKDLYWVPSIKDVVQHIDKYDAEKFKYDTTPRILIPFYNENGVLTHIQGRALGESELRYITLDVLDNVPKVYGMDRVNKDSTIYVLEGPFDSMFIDNAVAMAGADIDMSLFDKEKTIFVMDNEPRNRDIIKRMKNIVEQGYSICVWGTEIRGKDINKMVQNGYDVDFLQDHIDEHTYKGLKAKLQITTYSRV